MGGPPNDKSSSKQALAQSTLDGSRKKKEKSTKSTLNEAHPIRTKSDQDDVLPDAPVDREDKEDNPSLKPSRKSEIVILLQFVICWSINWRALSFMLTIYPCKLPITSARFLDLLSSPRKIRQRRRKLWKP